MSKPFKLKKFIKSRVDRVKSNIEGVGKRIGEKVEKVDKFLKNVEKGDFKIKSPNIKKELDWKYGHGEFADIKKRRKPGESKFKYDVRMREQGMKTPTATETSKNIMPDPKNEIKHLRGKTSMTSTLIGGDPLGLNKNPGDLRRQYSDAGHNLPSAPGDPFEYSVNSSGKLLYLDTRKGKDAEWQFPEIGSTEDKAIRQRYTGSETGDLSNWQGYDSYTDYGSYNVDPDRGFWVEGTHSKGTYTRKNYLPYDLAQKKYNPNYKGSKK